MAPRRTGDPRPTPSPARHGDVAQREPRGQRASLVDSLALGLVRRTRWSVTLTFGSLRRWGECCPRSALGRACLDTLAQPATHTLDVARADLIRARDTLPCGVTPRASHHLGFAGCSPARRRGERQRGRVRVTLRARTRRRRLGQPVRRRAGGNLDFVGCSPRAAPRWASSTRSSPRSPCAHGRGDASGDDQAGRAPGATSVSSAIRLARRRGGVVNAVESGVTLRAARGEPAATARPTSNVGERGSGRPDRRRPRLAR